jgi:hypothetical protein
MTSRSSCAWGMGVSGTLRRKPVRHTATHRGASVDASRGRSTGHPALVRRRGTAIVGQDPAISRCIIRARQLRAEPKERDATAPITREVGSSAACRRRSAIAECCSRYAVAPSKAVVEVVDAVASANRVGVGSANDRSMCAQPPRLLAVRLRAELVDVTLRVPTATARASASVVGRMSIHRGHDDLLVRAGERQKEHRGSRRPTLHGKPSAADVDTEPPIVQSNPSAA